MMVRFELAVPVFFSVKAFGFCFRNKNIQVIIKTPTASGETNLKSPPFFVYVGATIFTIHSTQLKEIRSLLVRTYFNLSFLQNRSDCK